MKLLQKLLVPFQATFIYISMKNEISLHFVPSCVCKKVLRLSNTSSCCLLDSLHDSYVPPIQ